MSEKKFIVDAQDIVVEYPLQSVRTSTLKEYVLRRLDNSLKVETHRALNQVTVQAEPGECVAIVGHNGCGKSTFLKVVAGILIPRSGTISTKGRLAPLIELGTGFDAELTGRENVYLSCSLLGLSRKEIDERLPEIQLFAELGDFFDAPVKTYSSGMYMRLGFSCSTVIEPDLLLVDEILAVGDVNFQKKSYERMMSIRAGGTTILFVSHDANAIKRIADRVVVLEHGNPLYSGDVREGLQLYTELMEKARIENLPEQQKLDELRKVRMRENDSRRARTPDSAEPTGRIVSMKVSSEMGVGRVSSGKQWKLIAEIELDQDMEQPVVVGFAIHSRTGIRIMGGNTKLFGAKGSEHLTKKGKHLLEFEFNRMDLATGEYRLVGAIHNWELDTSLDYDENINDVSVVYDQDSNNFDGDIVPAKPMVHQVSVYS